jgi:hypothetical protein
MMELRKRARTTRYPLAGKIARDLPNRIGREGITAAGSARSGPQGVAAGCERTIGNRQPETDDYDASG